MRFQRLSALVIAPLLASTLLACGGGDDDGEPAGEPKSLQERLFSSSGIDFAQQEQFIRECMTREGFEYTPRDTRDTANTVSFDPNSEEFVRERGFGISTMFATEIQIAPMDEDPNMKYRESLDETQRAAYDRALYGDMFGSGGTAGSGAVISIGGSAPVISGSEDGEDSVVQPVAVSGCMGEAFEAAGGSEAMSFDAELFDDLRNLETRINADPEMVEAMKGWSECMADSGYQFRDRDQAMTEIREEFAEITGLELAGDGGGVVISAASSGVFSVEGDDSEPFDPFANVDKEKLTALQDKEKRLALASLECSQEHVAETEAEVRERLEAEFIESHPELQDRATP